MNVVAHNLAAMNAQRQYNLTLKNRQKSAEKLSSGYRINRAADDAAGLSISEKMRKQIRGLNRGSENSQEGISLCQVADGALSEVNEMLHRLTELSVKAANGTNSTFDRQCIQNEINEILVEINRIGETTTFNERPIFQGTTSMSSSANGSTIQAGDIPFGDFALVDVNLGNTPISGGTSADMMNLQAIVNNPDSPAYGNTYRLIYGNGSTSNSSIRINGATNVLLETLPSSNYNYDQAAGVWSRDFAYTGTDVAIGATYDLTITQKISIEETSDTEKNYIISYDIKNNDAANPVDVEFMFHADTAYNNKDRVEGYFVGGQRIEETCVYSEADSPLIDGETSNNIYTGNVPESFSVVDVENALAFSEKISFDGFEKPDSISIGYYSQIDDWSYYESLSAMLGNDTQSSDLGFSLYYDIDLAQGANKRISFKYGIVATEADLNLTDVVVQKDTSPLEEVYGHTGIWIQSGCDAGDGMVLRIDAMNAKVLGIEDLNVMSEANARTSIETVEGALTKVLKNRSRIGAQQNRLEHTVANTDNVVENTTAAESRIRDTDMAEEMVNLSKSNILAQAGQAMMAQANTSTQGVLSLLG